MNSSNVSGDKAFEKWWDKSIYESYDNSKIVAKDVWMIKQARIDRLEEALKKIENLHDDEDLKDWDNSSLLNLAMNIAHKALTPDSQEGK